MFNQKLNQINQVLGIFFLQKLMKMLIPIRASLISNVISAGLTQNCSIGASFLCATQQSELQGPDLRTTACATAHSLISGLT